MELLTPEIFFTTDKGSIYMMDIDGRCQRNKSYHPGHGKTDQGVKEIYNHVLFLTSVEHSYDMLNALEHDKSWLVTKEDIVAVIAERDTRLVFLTQPVKFERTPKVGYAPIEVMEFVYHTGAECNLAQKKYHFGNVIDKVFTSK